MNKISLNENKYNIEKTLIAWCGKNSVFDFPL